VALPGKRVGEKIFFLRFSTDAIVLLTNWVREGLYCYAVGTNTFRDWSCFFLGRVFPVEAEMVQHSAALVHVQSSQEHFRRA